MRPIPVDTVAQDPGAAPLHRLQGIDRSQIGLASLYLASASAVPLSGPITLHPGDWLGSGTFRNSFYLAPWKRLSLVEDLWLSLEFSGSVSVRVMRAGDEAGPPILEFAAECDRRARVDVPLGWLADQPEEARLYWHLEATQASEVFEVDWCTRTPPVQAVRLAVLMRTHGRSSDLRQQLRRFAEGRQGPAPHVAALRDTGFWVLDSSADAASQWPPEEALGLALQVMTAPNLGGGGNASHLISRFLLAQEALPEAQRANELLILDDDGSVSVESLARYRARCAWRRGEFLLSLPVLMKSEPHRVWEDGGFWGRAGFAQDAGDEPSRGLSPSLVRHGLSLKGYEHLDQFNALNRCEYATFIFLGLPVSLLPRLGLPAALFLRGDDIEYSLRAQRLGVPLYTDPNLAAWHEPGHGYAQEYMAILHGCLVNFDHAAPDPAALSAFFEERMHAHARLGDLAGLALYQQVLDDLLDPHSELLTPEFARHYLARLPRLGAPMKVIAPAELAQLQRQAEQGAIRLLPWLYPGPPPAAPASSPTVLLHPAASSCRVLPPCEPAERLLATRHLVDRLLQLSAEHERLRAHWRERLRHSGTAAFWQQLRETHAEASPWLRQHAWSEPAPGAPAPGLRRPPPPPRAVAEAADHAAAASAAEPSRKAPWWQRLGPRRAHPERPAGARSGRLDELPTDFNPSTYLALHADVARTGMDPARHYLHYGRHEGRRYRPA